MPLKQKSKLGQSICKKLFCKNPIIDGLKYCKGCACSKDICPEMKCSTQFKSKDGCCTRHAQRCSAYNCASITESNTRPFCTLHICPFPNCVKPMTYRFGGNTPCDDHRCIWKQRIYTGYGEISSIDQCHGYSIGTGYCATHACCFQGCKGSITDPCHKCKFCHTKITGFISNELICTRCCCVIAGCTNTKTRTSSRSLANYCSSHKCEYDSCNKISLADSKGCKKHTCYFHSSNCVVWKYKYCGECVRKLKEFL